MTGNPDLLAAIGREIAAAGGRIPFVRFMDLALYHPRHGYYTNPQARPRIGKTGDFFTSVSTGPVFGRILARQFQRWGVTAVTEFGGHRGQLQADILAAAPELEYRVVEIDSAATAGARPPGLRHAETAPAAEAGAPMGLGNASANGAPGGRALPEVFSGCVFSNEFLDALPVHRLVGAQEVYVNAQFQEELGPLTDPRLPRLPDGYRSEINLRALDWLTDIATRLTPGSYILSIDYGFERPDYFAPHRHEGHLQCYHRHTKNADPYRHIGDQDITAHVEFSSLIEHGEALGLETVLFTDQTHFLLEAGAAEIEAIVTRDAGKLSPERNAIHQLLHSSMGHAFKVLVQRRPAA